MRVLVPSRAPGAAASWQRLPLGAEEEEAAQKALHRGSLAPAPVPSLLEKHQIPPGCCFRAAAPLFPAERWQTVPGRLQLTRTRAPCSLSAGGGLRLPWGIHSAPARLPAGLPSLQGPSPLVSTGPTAASGAWKPMTKAPAGPQLGTSPRTLLHPAGKVSAAQSPHQGHDMKMRVIWASLALLYPAQAAPRFCPPGSRASRPAPEPLPQSRTTQQPWGSGAW